MKPPSEPYTFRGGYIEDAAGDRWWSSELLAKVEKERDQLKEELEKLHRLAPTGTYTANATYEMQLLTVKQERDEAIKRWGVTVERWGATERERDEARAECERLREGIECHVARPGEGTYECSVERKCPACRLRHAEGALRTVAQRQKAAMLATFDHRDSYANYDGEEVWNILNAVPLVTEGDK